MSFEDVMWHEVECGRYDADLPLWFDLAHEARGGVLDVGAGTGRVTRVLAAGGHAVTALDRDRELLAALRERSGGAVETVLADARDFDAGAGRFALVVVPMQTIQLLGGSLGHAAFLRCAHRALRPGGRLAAALADPTDGFDEERTEMPLPDLREVDGWVFASQLVTVRAEPGACVIERIRETVSPRGERTAEGDVVRLDALEADTLERHAEQLGFAVESRRRVALTEEYVGSDVVVLRRV